MAEIDLPAGPLGQSIRVLSRQTGDSIGFRDPRLAGLRVAKVHGRYTTAQALERMLRGTNARARGVTAGAYLIEWSPPAPPSRPKYRAVAKPAPAPPVEPDEIIVTATKRNMPLGAYPGGVEVIDGEDFSTADGRDGTDAIEARVASISSTHLGPGRNKLFIRGIADSSFVGPTQATVGQYWGNSRITYSAPDPNLKLYDVERVEVLEGPQGTLYGAGSLGGVVRVVPRAPDLGTLGGAAWAGAQAVEHGQPGSDGGAIVNVPLVDGTLAFRGLAFGSMEGGYIDDVGRNLKDVNRVKTIGGRAALRYAPDNSWTLDLSAVGQRIDGDDSQYAEPSTGYLSRSSQMAQPFRNDYWLVDLVARKRWNDLEFTASAGYASQYVYELFQGPELADSNNPARLPAATAPVAGFSQANRISMFTAETRLAKSGANGTGWLIAASLLSNQARVNRNMNTTLSDASLTGVANHVDEMTLYGEGTVALAPRVTLTAGGRLTHSRLWGSSQDVLQAVALTIDPHADATRSETRFLPSAALAYRPTSRLTLFARYQQSFRPGGVAVRQAYIQRFKGDRLGTAEAGARYEGRKVDLALSGSWTRWTNIQADVIDGFGFPTTTNAGDGRVLSLGVSTYWRPTSKLTFDASLYLNDSVVTRQAINLVPIMIQTPNGLVANVTLSTLATDFVRLPNVANTSGRVGFAYRTPVARGSALSVKGYARYVGKSTLGIGPILGQPQGNYLDTGLEARVGTARRGITLSLTNLLDSRGNRFALGSPFLIRDHDQITPLQPRTLRLGFDLGF